MTNSFLPDNYEVPTASNGYMKLKPGENRFRILAPALLGLEAWTNENKPIRFRPEEKVVQDPNWKSPLKHFWAFPVWNYQEKRFQILELTQKSIMNSIAALSRNKKWGSPFDYDIVVTREGEGMETSYLVTPDPKEPFDEKLKKEFESLNVNLEALYEGKDPYENVGGAEMDYKDKSEDLPF